MKLNKYWESFCCYVLVVSTTPKKVFSRCNFSNNYVQVLSSMHSNMQLLYLLLFFAVIGGAAVLALRKLPIVVNLGRRFLVPPW